MPGTQKPIPRARKKERTRTRLPRRKEKKRGNGQRRYGKTSLRLRSSPGSLRRQLGSSGMHTQRKTVQRTTVHWPNETSRVTNQKVDTKTRFLDGLKNHVSFSYSSVSKMEVIRDDICFILDLEGFFINKTFHVRELGYYTWNEEHGRHAFRIPVPRQDLAQKDKQTVNFVIRKIHGLSYQPSQAEHPQHPRVVPIPVAMVTFPV